MSKVIDNVNFIDRIVNEEYFSKEIIDLKKYLTETDFEILRKLEIKVKEKIYTEYEFELLSGEIVDYYQNDEMDEEELKMGKDLEKTGVTREKYNKLLDKIHNISLKYSF